VLHEAFNGIFNTRFLNKKNVEQKIKKTLKNVKTWQELKNVKKCFLHLCREYAHCTEVLIAITRIAVLTSKCSSQTILSAGLRPDLLGGELTELSWLDLLAGCGAPREAGEEGTSTGGGKGG